MTLSLKGVKAVDFKRIEIIFILTFLALNAFLLLTYFGSTENDFSRSSPNVSIDLAGEMEEENITLPDFDEIEHELAYVQADHNTLLEDNIGTLSAQTGRIEDEGSLYVSLLSDPIAISEELNSELSAEELEALNEFVNSDRVLFGDQYQFLRYIPGNQQIIYSQLANNIPITDGTAEIIFYLDSNGSVYSYEQSYAGPVTVQGEGRNLITDKNAVEILYQNNEIQSDSVVSKPILSYYRTLNLDDLSMYAPVWYIEVRNNSETVVKRVDAINGSIVRLTSTENVPAEEAEEEAEEETENGDSESEPATVSPNEDIDMGQ